MKFRRTFLKANDVRRPVTVMQAKPVDQARVNELGELIYQTFIGIAPTGRSLPNVVTDVRNRTINLRSIASDDKRYADALMYLKMAWTDPPAKIARFDVTDKTITPVYQPAVTEALDSALMAVYGYNPFIA
jgi:hypothetical protein